MRDLQAPEPNLDPIGRIVVLEDTDNDGKMDKRTVFADGLVQARAVKVLDHGVLVLEPPNVWLMHDTNGDLKMDTKELVGTDYGRREGGVEGNANSFFWGLDNYLHSAGRTSTYSLRLKDGVFEVGRRCRAASGASAQDDAGRIFRNTNESALHVDLVPTPYFARNPALLRTRGSYEVADERREQHQRGLAGAAESRHQPRVPGRHHAAVRRHARAVHGGVRARWSIAAIGCRPSSTATCSSPSPPPTSSAGIVLERRRHDAARAQGVRQGGVPRVDRRAVPAGVPLERAGRHAYVVDIYRGIIQDRASTTVYLRDHIQKRKLDAPMGVGMGRIYRVVHDSTQRDPTSRSCRARRRRSSCRRCRIRTAGGATRRSGCSSSAAARRSSPQLKALATGDGAAAHARARAVDARRHRRHRRRDGDQGAGGSVARRAHVGGAHCRALAGRRRTARFRPRS